MFNFHDERKQSKVKIKLNYTTVTKLLILNGNIIVSTYLYSIYALYIVIYI